MMFPRIALAVCIVWSCSIGSLEAQNPQRTPLRAGVYCKNINPETFPVWVNGGIAASQADRVHDPLSARCLVLESDGTRVALCIVDNCILPIELVDEARRLSSERTGIPPSHILIAATHTHSAVSVAGVHGTPVQEDYAAKLPGWIAEGIEQAGKKMVDAQWGTTSVVCDKYVYCRRWLMKPGKATEVPFTGRESNQVSMNPGHDNPDKLAPVGPVDRLIPILSIQTSDGKPLALLASFSTHYAGTKALSADYFAVVCNELANKLRPEDPEAFLGLMANATSGDANCIDFSKPREPFTHVEVGRYVAEKILSVVPNITYQRDVSLQAVFDSITVAARVPTEEEVQEAKMYRNTHFPDRLPKSMPENYARETILLSELPKTRDLRLQVIRLDDFGIVANPCESYAETGLKLRQASPFALTMNIGLANGHGGYIPPPHHFQLGGYTTWRARSSCLEEQAEPKMVQRLTELMQTFKKTTTNDPQPMPVPKNPLQDSSRIQGNVPSKNGATAKKGPTSPLAPQESVQWMEVEEGMQVRLVASEPHVVDPVAIQIDAVGRLWAVEMRDYPNGVADNQGKGIGRIVVLEDQNQDGVYDHSQVFADGLLFPTGIQLWKNGVFATVAGELIYLADENGDLKADSKEPVLRGFAVGNPQLRANHPTLAPDGWLYVANGLRGGKVQRGGAGESLDLAGRDLRYHVVTKKVEAITGPSQFGMSLDAFGYRYGCANRQPCIEALVEQSELAISPLAGFVPPWINALPSEAQSTVHPLVDAWVTSNLHSGQFTAACGVLVTHSMQLPSTPYAHVLTCEPTGSLVQRQAISHQGRASMVVPAPQREWLASRDPWFRPVNLMEGPYGSIYVVDMYRAVIEHPEWVPKELKNRPDERYGDTMGRVYAVGKQGTSERFSFDGSSVGSLLKELESPHDWNRRTAARLLLESGDTSFVEAIKDIALRNPRPEVRSHAYAMLGAWNRWDEETAIASVSDLDPRVRQASWRMLSDYYPERTIRLREMAMEALTSDQPDIVRNVCWYLAKSQTEGETLMHDQMIERTTRAALKWEEDGHVLMAAAAAMRFKQVPFLLSWIRGLEAKYSRSAEPVGASVSGSLQAIIRFCRSIPEKELVVLQTECQHYMVKAGAEETNVAPITRSIALSLIEGLWNARKGSGGVNEQERHWLHPLIAKESLRSEDRMQAMRLLRFDSSQESLAILLGILQRSKEMEWQRAALSGLGCKNSSELEAWLFETLERGTPGLRTDVFTAIRSHPDRLLRLVERLEQGKTSIRNLDASQRQTLKAITDTKVKDRIAAILEQTSNPNREKVVQKYKSSMEGRGDLVSGRALFAKNCASCHRLEDVGYSVGPDISDTRDQTYEKLLISVLDPNRSIDANYFRYVAVLDDGQVVEGLLRDLSAATVTLRSQNGKDQTIEREQIQELKSMGVSLMPEGMEEQISVDQMRDILYYLKNWRYESASVPAVAAP
ncbi:MAG: PVC-type heme-binding CxxCH protein [Pirellulales bacterium]